MSRKMIESTMADSVLMLDYLHSSFKDGISDEIYMVVVAAGGVCGETRQHSE